MPDNISPPAPPQKVPWFLTRKAAIWGLLLVGPFALPLVWYSPAFKKNTKIIITLIVAVLTYISYIYTPVLLDNLSKRLESLQGLTKSS